MDLTLQDIGPGRPAPVTGAPDWDTPWIDPALHARLWQPDRSVWWLVDPTRAAAAVPFPPLEAAQGDTHVVTRTIDPALEEAGPRLIGPIDPVMPGSVERLAFGALWSKGAGILISAPGGAAAGEALALHLAAWVQRPLEGASARLFVRFWQPDVLCAWLAQFAGDRARRVAPLFAGPDGPLEVTCEMPDGGARLWRMAGAKPGMPPPLDAEEMDALNRHRRRRYCRDTMAWIADTWGMRQGAGLDVLAATAARQLDGLDALGIRSEYAVNYTIAGLYLLGRGLDELEPGLHAILSDTTRPQAARAEAFLTTAQDRTGYRPKGAAGG